MPLTTAQILKILRELGIGKELLLGVQPEDTATRRAGIYPIRINEHGEVLFEKNLPTLNVRELRLIDDTGTVQRILYIGPAATYYLQIRDGALTHIMDIEAHKDRHAAGGADALTDLTKAQLATNTLQWEVHIPLCAAASLDAGTATPDCSVDVVLSSEMLACAKSAYFEASYKWADTADGALQLYDLTAPGVIISLTTRTGGEDIRRERSANILTDLTAGNTLTVRANITTTVTGETVEIRYARLVLVLGAA